ncbi:MAG: hypothetical protein IPH05_17515 [Flavobacteriales bacterium]|nr:hypothetical protein [Flavobacteriales bacterium]
MLHVAMDCSLTEFEFVLFDRWGVLLHRTDDPEFRWSGDGVPVGVCLYTQLRPASTAGNAYRAAQRKCELVTVNHVPVLRVPMYLLPRSRICSYTGTTPA